MANTFTCACCGETFEKARTDEEATAEALQRYGAELLAAEPLETVCEDCAALIYQWQESSNGT